MSGGMGKWLSFMELQEFVADWRRLGLDDDSLRELELMLLDRPTIGPVVAGTGGVRKARFAPSAWGRGKSGATRVRYVLFLDAGTVVLMGAFGKSEKSNFTPAERSVLRQAVAELRRSFGEQHENR